MSKIEFLDKTKKKKIIGNLNENYGIESLQHLFIRSGNDKIRIYSGGLSLEELNLFGKNLRLELIGASLGNTEELAKNDLVVIKNNEDLLGVAKNRKTYIQNYVPKERRIK